MADDKVRIPIDISLKDVLPPAIQGLAGSMQEQGQRVKNLIDAGNTGVKRVSQEVDVLGQKAKLAGGSVGLVKTSLARLGGPVGVAKSFVSVYKSTAGVMRGFASVNINYQKAAKAAGLSLENYSRYIQAAKRGGASADAANAIVGRMTGALLVMRDWREDSPLHKALNVAGLQELDKTVMWKTKQGDIAGALEEILKVVEYKGPGAQQIIAGGVGVSVSEMLSIQTNLPKHVHEVFSSLEASKAQVNLFEDISLAFSNLMTGIGDEIIKSMVTPHTPIYGGKFNAVREILVPVVVRAFKIGVKDFLAPTLNKLPSGSQTTFQPLPGHAYGGVVGLHGPEMIRAGEMGREAIIPVAKFKAVVSQVARSKIRVALAHRRANRRGSGVNPAAVERALSNRLNIDTGSMPTSSFRGSDYEVVQNKLKQTDKTKADISIEIRNTLQRIESLSPGGTGVGGSFGGPGAGAGRGPGSGRGPGTGPRGPEGPGVPPVPGFTFPSSPAEAPEELAKAMLGTGPGGKYTLGDIQAAVLGRDPGKTGKALSTGFSADALKAVKALADKMGVSPEAIAAVSQIESNFKPGAVSRSGTYHGLFQLDASEGARAGWSDVEQVQAYGKMLENKQFLEKLKQHGINISTLSPSQQAALLQGFQFAPNANAWMSNFAVPSTRHPQAGSLGDTSVNAMQRYFEKAMGGTSAGASPEEAKAHGFSPTALGAPLPVTPTAPGAVAGAGSDIEYLASHGAHSTVAGRDVPLGTIAVDPEFAARLAAAGRAYKAETGREPEFHELSRDYATQAEYYRRYLADPAHGLAARPGTSRHEVTNEHAGQATDLPDGPFRDWMTTNRSRFGIEGLRDRRDPNHQQINRNYRGPAFYHPEQQQPATAPPTAVTPGTSTSHGTARGTFLFLRGQYRGPEAEARIQAAARQIADDENLDFEVLDVSGNNPGQQLALARARMKKGDIKHLYGFSAGAYTANKLEKESHPGTEITKIGAPDLRGDITDKGKKHLDQVPAHAAKVHAEVNLKRAKDKDKPKDLEPVSINKEKPFAKASDYQPAPSWQG